MDKIVFIAIKSRKVRLAGYMACMKREVHSGIWWRTLKERSHSEDQGGDGRIILKSILKL
jgi:hypothetical protein